jgi:hypothetical protein
MGRQDLPLRPIKSKAFWYKNKIGPSKRADRETTQLILVVAT